jgi:hypothetical protein
MFPLKDDNPTEIFPVVTLLLIAACLAAWWFLQGAGVSEVSLTDSVCALGAIPAEVTGASAVRSINAQPSPGRRPGSSCCTPSTSKSAAGRPKGW